eukprot:CAMPEP_0195104390 /NCGR_PEP_ID=MMETSP0448-20130528/73074_1 /TAXON_ID=66468 /ORGANISM="Heterocapsa triquestra, Strain CCMP 448" /LENGTH=111 /DNA_ID=CAMNT_0040140223 /DNA_START=117 /DNA_END=450 /DNA_ORIENTATION=+
MPLGGLLTAGATSSRCWFQDKNGGGACRQTFCPRVSQFFGSAFILVHSDGEPRACTTASRRACAILIDFVLQGALARQGRVHAKYAIGLGNGHEVERRACVMPRAPCLSAA